MSPQNLIDQPANHRRVLQDLAKPCTQRSARQKLKEDNFPLRSIPLGLGKSACGQKAFMSELPNDRDNRLAHLSCDSCRSIGVSAACNL